MNEAEERERLIAEALTWVGTPFRDCGDIKGPNGAVDCAMLLVRCVVDTGLAKPFDPRPYSPRWHVHQSAELFVGILKELGARQVDEAKIGDLIIWQWGKCYAHGGIKVSDNEVVHAYGPAGFVLVSRLDEPLLTHVGYGSHIITRPVLYFDYWATRR